MKNEILKTTCFIGLLVSMTSISFGQIANSYPHDSLIQTDPSVIFTEMGEESTLTNLFANWSSNSSSNSIALDATTSPPSSLGNQSIRLFTTGAPALPAAIRLGFLRKTFPLFIGDTVYIRWYAKYNTTGLFHHSGVWMGGENPISNTPQNIAGHLPIGSDFFMVGSEVKSAPIASTTSKFDSFIYWPQMRHNSAFSSTLYYGNSFINSPAVSISMSIWNCFETRLILNNPVSGYGGEVAMWINGNQVSDVKLGTLGNWNEDDFTPNISGSPFEGFQFRNTTALNFDYFQLQHYTDRDLVVGFINSVNYDHIVVAKHYIGPIYVPLTTGTTDLTTTNAEILFPNPTNDIVKLNRINSKIKIYNMQGQLVFEFQNTDQFSTRELLDGMYIIHTEKNTHKLIVKH